LALGESETAEERGGDAAAVKGGGGSVVPGNGITDAHLVIAERGRELGSGAVSPDPGEGHVGVNDKPFVAHFHVVVQYRSCSFVKRWGYESGQSGARSAGDGSTCVGVAITGSVIARTPAEAERDGDRNGMPSLGIWRSERGNCDAPRRRRRTGHAEVMGRKVIM